MSSRARLALLAVLPAALAAAAGSGAAPAPEPPPEAVLLTLPFRPSPQTNRVVVDIAPAGGDRLEMLLDTGATTSVITPVLARSLGIAVRRTKSSPYRRGTALGRDLQFWVDTGTTDTASRTGWEYGLLGGEFLHAYVVEIDFPGRRVRFLDPKRYSVPESTDAPDEAVIAVRIVARRILVPVELSGKPLELMLDTGAPYPMILSGQAAKELEIDVDTLARFGTGGTVVGPMDQRFYEASDFRLGGFVSAPFPVIVAPKGWYNLGAGNDSVIGYDALSPYVLRIDYARQRLWLRRTGDPQVTLLGSDYEASKKVGALLTRSHGALYVHHVVPDGLAARYGLRDGDAIVPLAGEELLRLEEILARIAARQELTVARPQEGDVYVDTVLPVEAAPQAGRGPAPVSSDRR